MRRRSPMPFGLGSWSSSPMDSCQPLFELERADLPTVIAKRDPASGGCQGGSEAKTSGEGGKKWARSESPTRGRESHRRGMGCRFRQPRNLGAMVLKIVLEPERKRIRVAFDAPADVVERPVRDVGDLGRVGLRLGLQPSEIDVDELVLMHAVAELGLVAGEKTERPPPPPRRALRRAGGAPRPMSVRPGVDGRSRSSPTARPSGIFWSCAAAARSVRA